VFFQLEITQVWSLARKGHKFTGTARLINTRGWKIEPMLDRAPLIQASMKQSIEKVHLPNVKRVQTTMMMLSFRVLTCELWYKHGRRWVMQRQKQNRIQKVSPMENEAVLAKDDCGICLIIEGLNSTRWCLPACLPTQPFKFGMKWT
jgi:hypothetical protein